MAKDVIMPVLGMNQDSGVLVSWLKQEGDTVAEGEPLMEVETDKAVMEIEATASGTLVQVSASAGDEIPTGTVIARIVADGEAVPDAPPTGSASAAASSADSEGGDAAGTAAAPETAKSASTADGSETADRADPAPTGPGVEPPAATGDAPRTLASPKARRLADERGIPLASLGGTGPHGAVIARDVPAQADAPAPVAAAAAPATLESLEATVPATALQALLERLGDAGDAPGSILPALLVKFAAASAAKRALFGDDAVDVRLRRSDGSSVDLPAADRRGVRALADRIADPEAFDEAIEGVRFLSVTVLDDLRIEAVRAAPTGGAALAVGAVTPRPVAVDGGVEVRPTVTLTFGYDAGSVDLARAARTFDDVVGLVTDPTELVVLF